MRNEAVACLALCDLSLTNDGPEHPIEQRFDRLCFEPEFKRYPMSLQRGRLVIRDARTDEILDDLPMPRHNGVSSGRFSSDGNYFSAVLSEGRVFVWDLRRHDMQKRIAFPRAYLPGHSVAFTQDSEVVAVATTNRSVRLFKLESGEELPSLETGVLPLQIAFSPTGNKLALVEAGRVGIWSVTERKELNTLSHNGRLTKCGWHPDGRISARQSARGLAQSKIWRPAGARNFFRFNVALKKRIGLKSAALFALAALFLCGTSARAQSYSLDWSTVDGGGGTSTGGVYSVSGSIGQPEAGPTMSGGNFSVDGGFWSVLGAVRTPGLPLLTIALTTTNTAVVSWPYPSPGFALQQNPALGTTDWTSVTNSVLNNGSFKWVVVPANASNKFFRLVYP